MRKLLIPAVSLAVAGLVFLGAESASAAEAGRLLVPAGRLGRL